MPYSPATLKVITIGEAKPLATSEVIAKVLFTKDGSSFANSAVGYIARISSFASSSSASNCCLACFASILRRRLAFFTVKENCSTIVAPASERPAACAAL